MTTSAELDRMYEQYTDRLIEERFGTEKKDAHVVEALKDVEIALKKLRECRDWLDTACAEDVPFALENLIGSYYEQMDDLTVKLDIDLEKWSERRWE